MRGIVALLLALAFTACQHAASPTELDPSLGAVGAEGVLSTDREAYEAPATAVVRLKNPHPFALGYNLCTSVLERQIGDSWRTSELGNDRVCTMELRILKPGETATFSAELDGRLPAGSYRYRTSVERMGEGTSEQVASNTFRIVD